jgi:WD40 repeat protein
VGTADGVEVENPNVRFDGIARWNPAPDTRYVVIENEGSWHVSDTVSGAKIPVKTTGEEDLDNPTITRDGSLLVFGGKKRGESGFSVFIYTLKGVSFEIARSFPVAAYPASFAISADNRHVAVSHGLGSDGKLRVFDIQDWHDRTPAEVAKLTFIDSFEFAPDGKTLAVQVSLGGQASVGVWRLRDGRQVGILQGSEQISNYSFNSTSDRLAVAMKQDSVELLDLHTGRTTALPTNRRIELVTFSPNGRLLATADEQGLVTLVDLASLDEVANLPHENKVSQITFSQDGRYLATATNAEDPDAAPPDERHSLHVWLLRPEELIKEACQRLTRLRTTELSYCAPR